MEQSTREDRKGFGQTLRMKTLSETDVRIFPPYLSIIGKSTDVYFLEGVGLKLVMPDSFIFLMKWKNAIC